MLERSRPGDGDLAARSASDSLISSRIVVDLPEPLAPTRNTNSPGWIANETPSRPMSPLG